MKRSRDLTTTEVGKCLGCSQSYAIKIIERGELKAYRIGGAKHRRVQRATVRAYMAQHGIPVMDGVAELLAEIEAV